MTSCKGEDCKFYQEFQADIDQFGAGCSHPDFDETKHSIRYGPCPGFVEIIDTIEGR